MDLDCADQDKVTVILSKESLKSASVCNPDTSNNMTACMVDPAEFLSFNDTRFVAFLIPNQANDLDDGMKPKEKVDAFKELMDTSRKRQKLDAIPQTKGTSCTISLLPII